MSNRKAGGDDDEKGGSKREGFPRFLLEGFDVAKMRALAAPLRLRVLAVLCDRVASPSDIARELNVDVKPVSYHVRVLKESGLVEQAHISPAGGNIERFYRAAAPTLFPPRTWDGLPLAVREGRSPHILQAFFEDARQSMQAGVFDSDGALSWTPLILDQEGLGELNQMTHAFEDAVLDVQKRASARFNAKGTDLERLSTTVFLSSFQSARSPAEEKKASARLRR